MISEVITADEWEQDFEWWMGVKLAPTADELTEARRWAYPDPESSAAGSNGAAGA